MKRIAALVSLSLFACRTPGPPTPSGPLPSAEVLLEQLAARAETRQSVRASGRVTYFGAKGRVRLRAVFLAERPGRFRVETLSPLEQPIEVMTSNGERLWLLSEGRLREGPATPENIARVLPIPLRAEDLVELLLGGVPTRDRLIPRAVVEEDDAYRLDLVTDQGVPAQLRVARSGGALLSAALGRPGTRDALEVRFDRFETPTGASEPFPHAMSVSMPGRDLELEVALKDIAVNVDLAPTLFEWEAGGVPAEPLDSPPAPAGR